MRALAFATIVAALSLSGAAGAQEMVKLFAAGSLRAALTEVGAAFTQAGGAPVAGEFGASGLLRDRLASGERADVFASANMEHPASLAAAGKSGPVAMFARNRLCALAAPGLDVTPANLLDRMLDPSVRLGMSTPKADPSGDSRSSSSPRPTRCAPARNPRSPRRHCSSPAAPTRRLHRLTGASMAC